MDYTLSFEISRTADGGMCNSSESGEERGRESGQLLAFLAEAPKGLLRLNSFFGSAAGLAWSQLKNTGMDLILGFVFGGNNLKNKSRHDLRSESLFCNNFHVDASLTFWLVLILDID